MFISPGVAPEVVPSAGRASRAARGDLRGGAASAVRAHPVLDPEMYGSGSQVWFGAVFGCGSGSASESGCGQTVRVLLWAGLRARLPSRASPYLFGGSLVLRSFNP